jgi:hypothetical protein
VSRRSIVWSHGGSEQPVVSREMESASRSWVTFNFADDSTTRGWLQCGRGAIQGGQRHNWVSGDRQTRNCWQGFRRQIRTSTVESHRSCGGRQRRRGSPTRRQAGGPPEPSSYKRPSPKIPPNETMCRGGGGHDAVVCNRNIRGGCSCTSGNLINATIGVDAQVFWQRELCPIWPSALRRLCLEFDFDFDFDFE